MSRDWQYSGDMKPNPGSPVPVSWLAFVPQRPCSEEKRHGSFQSARANPALTESAASFIGLRGAVLEKRDFSQLFIEKPRFLILFYYRFLITGVLYAIRKVINNHLGYREQLMMRIKAFLA